jgi:hypothetical protein
MKAVLQGRAWVHARMASRLSLQHFDPHPALALPYTKMPPDSKPQKVARLRSRFKRLFSSSSGAHAQDGRDVEGIAQDLQALALDPSLPHVLAVGPDRGNIQAIDKDLPPPMGPSASTSMFSQAHHFNVGNIHMNSPHHVHNHQDKLIDGISIHCYKTYFVR